MPYTYHYIVRSPVSDKKVGPLTLDQVADEYIAGRIKTNTEIHATGYPIHRFGDCKKLVAFCEAKKASRLRLPTGPPQRGGRRPEPLKQTTTASANSDPVLQPMQPPPMAMVPAFATQSALLAVLLSILFPGLGQLYNGQGCKAAIFMLLVLFSAGVLYLVVAPIAAIDAGILARKRRWRDIGEWEWF